MPSPLLHHMLNRGTSGERRMARAMSRGRGRAPAALRLAEDAARRIAKDLGGSAGSPTTAAQVYTPVASNERKVRKSRLAIPHADLE